MGKGKSNESSGRVITNSILFFESDLPTLGKFFLLDRNTANDQ